MEATTIIEFRENGCGVGDKGYTCAAVMPTSFRSIRPVVCLRDETSRGIEKGS